MSVYENLFSSIKNSNIQPIFFNFRRPYFWNLKSFNIINQTEGQIITDKILTKQNREKILENQEKIKNEFNDLLKKFNFEDFFAINNNSFWNIIKKEFLNMCFTRINEAIELIEIGKSRKIYDGNKCCILNFGVLLNRVEKLAQSNGFGLYDMRFVKPIDGDALKEISRNYKYIVTLEDHTTVGGAGSAVGEFLHSIKSEANLLLLGLQDEFPVHGSRNEILAINGLDEMGIEKSIKNFFS